MSATTIFPLSVWQSGTNQNSIPANDNALRMQALLGAANRGFSTAAPATPVENDQTVVSTTWGGHAVGNILIYKGGTWYEFGVYNGMPMKMIGATDWYVREGGAWVKKILTTGS